MFGPGKRQESCCFLHWGGIVGYSGLRKTPRGNAVGEGWVGSPIKLKAHRGFLRCKRCARVEENWLGAKIPKGKNSDAVRGQNEEKDRKKYGEKRHPLRLTRGANIRVDWMGGWPNTRMGSEAKESSPSGEYCENTSSCPLLRVADRNDKELSSGGKKRLT